MEKIGMNLGKKSLTSTGKKEALRWVHPKLIGMRLKKRCVRTYRLQELSSGQTRICILDWRGFE
jgi:hypothetical protein